MKLFEALVEHEKIASFHRLTPCFCRNRPVLFKCTGLVVAFRLLCFEMPISQRQRGRHMAEKFVLTHTHTRDVIYEMFQGHCHSGYSVG